MIPLIRAECRKLLTVRSTYFIAGSALLIIFFMSFYIEGIRGMSGQNVWLMSLISDVSTTLSPFVAIMAILCMGHEYRFNTITYTLTAANSRAKVMLAKILVTLAYALTFTLIAWLFAALAYMGGASLSPHPDQAVVAPQVFWGDVWRSIYFVLGFSMIGLLLAFLFRHVVGAMAALFIWPAVESLLSPLLRHNARNLPFNLLEQIHVGIGSASLAALLFLAYVIVGWLVVWYLFTRRDAN